MGVDTKTKDNGWLGVDDMINKNVALVFKWWWRFSMEGNFLWKKAICSIHRLPHEIPLMQQQNNIYNGSIWSSIRSVDKWGKKFKSITNQGWWMRIGDGRKNKFWMDKWIGDGCLKDKFPRLFLVSSQKYEPIANLGVWDGIHWHWNLTWRRYLFQWEIQQLEELLNMVQQVNLSNTTQHKIW